MSKDKIKEITLRDQQFFMVWIANKLLKNFELSLTPFGLTTESLCGNFNVILDADFKRAFDFLNLDYKLYTSKKDANVLFTNIVNNKYFNNELVTFDTANIRAGTLGFKRLCILFRNFLTDKKPVDNYFFSNCLDIYYDILDVHFKIYENDFDSLEKTIEENSKKFNGSLVTEWTGILPSETLGIIITQFREPHGFEFEKYIQQNSAEQIKKDLIRCVKQNLVV